MHLFGLSSGEILTLLGIASAAGTLAFSVTPKGITALVSLNNWLCDHVFNGRINLRVERIERRQAHLYRELGIKAYEEEDSHEQTTH